MKDAPRHGYWLRTRPAGSAPVLWPSSKVFTPFLYVALYPSTVCIQRGAPAGKSCSNVGRIILSFSWSTMLTSASLPTTISPRSNRPAHTHRGNPVIITPSEGGKAEGHLSGAANGESSSRGPIIIVRGKAKGADAGSVRDAPTACAVSRLCMRMTSLSAIFGPRVRSRAQCVSMNAGATPSWKIDMCAPASADHNIVHIRLRRWGQQRRVATQGGGRGRAYRCRGRRRPSPATRASSQGHHRPAPQRVLF